MSVFSAHTRSLRADTASGDSASLGIVPSKTTTQRILVLPVVDMRFAYDPRNRQLNDANFPKNPKLRDDIVKAYGVVHDFWHQASFGILDLQADVPNCFYRTSSTFPNAGEASFQPAALTGTPVLFVKPGLGPSYEKLVIEYVTDPAQGVKTVQFVSDGVKVFDEPDALVEQFRAQLGAAATDLDISVATTGKPPATTGRVVFQIKDAQTFPGSKVTVGAASVPNSRIALGLTLPTLASTANNPAHVLLTTDGASIPGGFQLNNPGTRLGFTFTPPVGSTAFFTWVLTNPDGTPLKQNCSPNCPTWTGAADLTQLIRPEGNRVGIIRDVMVGGRKEFQFEMETFDSPPNTTFNGVSVTDAGDRTINKLGLQIRQSQQGTALGRNVTRDSGTLVRDALEAFLNTELADDSGCLPLGEIPSRPLNNPAAVKRALDTYLNQYSAIQAFLLTNENAIRDNATFAYLTTKLTSGASSMSYQVYSPVAAVQIQSGARTISHETGHNIGFPDLYDDSNTLVPGVPSDYDQNLTFPGKWDVMANQGDMPFPGAYLKQSWVGWISAGNGTVTRVLPGEDRIFVLTPSEKASNEYDSKLPSQANPVAKMLVLQLGTDDGTNPRAPTHFIGIENRQQLPGSPDPAVITFNAKLPFGGGVVVHDNLATLNVHGSFAKPIARNYSQTLTPAIAGVFPDADGRPVTGRLDLASTFPAYPGFIIEQLGTVPGPTPADPVSAVVHVVYPTTKQMDLSIEPWVESRSATRAIWFEPATSATPPANPPIPTDIGNVNVPVAINGYDPAKNMGKPLNWIHVKVDNASTSFNASAVKLRLSYNSPGGMGTPAHWEVLATNPDGGGKDIPDGTSAVYSFGWSPTADIAKNGHTCVAAEVREWNAEGFGQIGDVNPLNNVSQENIFKINVLSHSPWADVPIEVRVVNHYAHDAQVLLEPQHLPPGYSVTFDSWSAHVPANAAHVFSGTLHWDTAVIPIPPNQDPNDPFWTICDEEGDGGPPAAHCTNFWTLKAFAVIGDYRIPLGSTTYQTQGAPTTTLTGTPSVGAGGVIVVTGTISPPSTGQTVRVIIRRSSGAIDYTDVPTTLTGTYTTTFPPGDTGPVQVTVEVPPGGGPFDPVTIGDQVLGCGFLADKLAPKSCSGGPTKVDLGNIPAGCKAEIVSVDGTSLNPHRALSSGVVTLRPGNYVVHWTATNPVLASRVSADQTIAVVAQEPGLCCAAGQVAIVGTDQADSFTFTDKRAYCVVSGKGQDTVKTSSLADSLFGGPDGDLLFGGTGADLLIGGEGDDNLSSNGNLTALGGPGGDAISAANGKASVLYGGAGVDMLVGSPESDQLFPGSGANFTSGGQGNDTITILSACEITAGAFIDGGPGSDTLVTPVSLSTLQAMGVTVVSIEKVVVTSKDAHLSDCFPVTLAKAPACSTLPTWAGGGSYAPGSRVQNGGRSYECKPLPADRSCGDFDFQPGVSPNWPSAWKELGSCN